MLQLLIILSFCALSVLGIGELLILHSPPGLLFKGNEVLDKSNLKEVFTAAYGYTTEEDLQWNGMYISNPSKLAEAVAVVEIDGVIDLGITDGHSFPLVTDGEEEDVYEVLVDRLQRRNGERKDDYVFIDLSNGLTDLQDYKLFKGIKNIKPEKGTYGFLKLNVKEDSDFVHELDILNAITHKIRSNKPSKTNTKDALWLKFTSVYQLVDFHNENSTATKEATKLLSRAITDLKDALAKIYKMNVLVAVVANDISHHSRKTRSVPQPEKAAQKDSPYKNLNLADTYDANYPVVFNMILWFSVIMIFSLLAVCITIGSMDPGRDSIIYRMTSTRMKKDN